MEMVGEFLLRRLDKSLFVMSFIITTSYKMAYLLLS